MCCVEKRSCVWHKKVKKPRSDFSESLGNKVVGEFG